jgi:hypothetical protein
MLLHCFCARKRPNWVYLGQRDFLLNHYTFFFIHFKRFYQEKLLNKTYCSLVYGLPWRWRRALFSCLLYSNRIAFILYEYYRYCWE